ncbi:hypothetical protein ACTFIV_003366 [Dictyostelium citrinum]
MIGKINSKTSALFVCDIQTSFLKTLTQIDELIINNKSLMDSCLEFKIPIIMTQHDKNLFGEIVEPLRYTERTVLSSPSLSSTSPSYSSLSIVKVFDKITYSMYTKELVKYVNENLPNLKTVILTGLESHVCILQTALDLLEQGYEVHVIEDAVASVQSKECTSSLKRMQQSGVFLTSTESVIYQILQSDDHPKFKNIHELIFPKGIIWWAVFPNLTLYYQIKKLIKIDPVSFQFRQFIRGKPNSTGIKLYSIADSNGYLYGFFISLGKSNFKSYQLKDDSNEKDLLSINDLLSSLPIFQEDFFSSRDKTRIGQFVFKKDVQFKPTDIVIHLAQTVDLPTKHIFYAE